MPDVIVIFQKKNMSNYYTKCRYICLALLERWEDALVKLEFADLVRYVAGFGFVEVSASLRAMKQAVGNISK